MLAELSVRRSFRMLEGYIGLLNEHGTLNDLVINGQIKELRSAFETLGLVAPRVHTDEPADLVESERWSDQD